MDTEKQVKCEACGGEATISYYCLKCQKRFVLCRNCFNKWCREDRSICPSCRNKSEPAQPETKIHCGAQKFYTRSDILEKAIEYFNGHTSPSEETLGRLIRFVDRMFPKQED